jgi:Na+-translocating ferredoxin:NAD+ oxidoreductase RnfG subunit
MDRWFVVWLFSGGSILRQDIVMYLEVTGMGARWERREKKRNKRRNGMRVSGKSVFVILSEIGKRGNKKWKK